MNASRSAIATGERAMPPAGPDQASSDQASSDQASSDQASSDQIGTERLTSLFRPSSVALVGASDKSPFSLLAYRNLVAFGFGARTYLVSRRGTETHGQPTVTSCAQIGEPVDVAYLMVPQAGMLEALDDAAAAGIRNACVLSSGYAEAGEAGRAAQAELAAHAAARGMVLLGPNHLGFANFTDGVPVCSIPGLPRAAGPVALLSQSGASSSAMVDFAAMVNVGLSYLVTLGNEAMITAGHVLDFLVDDPGTRAVAIFMETVRDPDVFRRAARRAAEAGKAIVVLKAGSSALSARTAAAHTGALVGDDRVVDAVFADLGVIRVDSIEDMLITAGAAAALGRLKRTGIGIVSISGGACDIIADRADDLAAALPELSESTTNALAAIMPAYGTVQNPLDVTGAAILDPTIFTRSIEVMSADPSVGVVGVVNSIPWLAGRSSYVGQMFVDAIGAGMQAASCPTAYINQVMQPVTDVTRAAMEYGRVPYVIPGLRQAVVALRNVAWWSEATRTPAPNVPGKNMKVPPPAQRQGKWPEHAARRLLADAGIPVVPARLARSADGAVKAAAEIGGLLSVKVASADIVHKSDVGGVRLDVPADEDAVRAAYDAVTEAATTKGARIDGVLISPMRTGGAELLVGVVRDPQWGPVLAVAIGGVFVEVLRDSALAPLPVSAAQAGELLDKLRGRALLSGARGAAPADLVQLSAVIARIGDLALALGEDLESLEVNPLLVDGARIEALDVVVTWRY
jgi:acyl-CoA synthetase (NDP forming)